MRLITRRDWLGHCFTGLVSTVPWLSVPSVFGVEGSRAIRQLPSPEKIRSQPKVFWGLVDLINDYRGQNRLPTVPLSPRLTAVAALHVRDLARHTPHKKHGSLHSWSEDRRWNGGAYRPADKTTWPIMWEKPKEIAAYSGYGFEVAAANVRDLSHALDAWKKSPSHNNVLLNRDVWADQRWQWRALGAVFYRGFACAWFGEKTDAD